MANAQKTTLKTNVQDLIALTETFGILLEDETKFLKKADFKAVDALQAEKRDMARRYADLVTMIAGQAGDVETLDAGLREKLIRTRTKFTVTLDENLRILDATKSSARRLVDRILDAAQKTVVDERQTHYSAKGRTASWKTATMSLSVDQQL